MHKTVFCLAIVLFSGLAVAFDRCDKPYKVEVPDGASSSREEMIEAQKAIKAYISQAEAYLSCLEEENRKLATAILSEEAIEEERALTNRRYNAMVDEMTFVADQFNVQVREYKATANPG